MLPPAEPCIKFRSEPERGSGGLALSYLGTETGPLMQRISTVPGGNQRRMVSTEAGAAFAETGAIIRVLRAMKADLIERDTVFSTTYSI